MANTEVGWCAASVRAFSLSRSLTAPLGLSRVTHHGWRFSNKKDLAIRMNSDVEGSPPYHLIAQINLPLDLPVGGISRVIRMPSCCDSWRVPGQGHATSRTVTHSGALMRAAARKYDQLQAEDEETVPDWLADVAVVL